MFYDNSNISWHTVYYIYSAIVNFENLSSNSVVSSQQNNLEQFFKLSALHKSPNIQA